MGLNRSKKPAMYRLFRFVVNNVLRSGELRHCPTASASSCVDAAWRDRFRNTAVARRWIANNSFDQVSRWRKFCIKLPFAIAAMGVAPFCGRHLSRRINGRTDITWSAAAPRQPHAGIDTCYCRQTAHRVPTAWASNCSRFSTASAKR
jgi:hypothetical protein